MKKQNLDNKTLDIIGQKLIGSICLPENEIDKIVANPHLFTLVNKRISENLQAPMSGFLRSSRRIATAFGGIAVIVIAAIAAAMSLFSSENTQFSAERILIPEPLPEIKRPADPPQEMVAKVTAGRSFDRESSPVKPVAKKAAKPFAKKLARKPETQPTRETENGFYALSVAGVPDEIIGGSRIIRVDVPITSLYALGANIPLENGPDFVKADLLVGSDGVTRAIRVVE